PIENDAEPGAMAGVDQGRKIRRRSKPACGRELAGRLIAPGTIERMLGNGQELHMREVHLAHVAGELLGKLPIGEPTMALVGTSAPGAEMHFVDRDGRIESIAAGWRRRRPGDFLELG